MQPTRIPPKGNPDSLGLLCWAHRAGVQGREDLDAGGGGVLVGAQGRSRPKLVQLLGGGQVVVAGAGAGEVGRRQRCGSLTGDLAACREQQPALNLELQEFSSLRCWIAAVPAKSSAGAVARQCILSFTTYMENVPVSGMAGKVKRQRGMLCRRMFLKGCPGQLSRPY